MYSPINENQTMADFRREAREHTEDEARRAQQEHTTLLVEETMQLAMFDEPDELVQTVVVGQERH